MKLVFAILLAVLHGSSFAQTNTTGDAKSEGPCSPAVTGNNNTFTFKYCGNDPAETKKLLTILEALARGENITLDKLDEIKEILLRPIKITMTESTSVAAPPGGHPRAAVDFFTDDPVDRGQFEILCDRACAPIDACRLQGSNATILATVSDRPDIAEFLFQRQVPGLTSCRLTIESRDDKPIRIISLTTSRRTTHLVPNAVQPPRSVVAGGSVMQ